MSTKHEIILALALFCVVAGLVIDGLLGERQAGSQSEQLVAVLRGENARLSKLITDFQKEPHIVLSHNEAHYKCYKLEKTK